MKNKSVKEWLKRIKFRDEKGKLRLWLKLGIGFGVGSFVLSFLGFFLALAASAGGTVPFGIQLLLGICFLPAMSFMVFSEAGIGLFVIVFWVLIGVLLGVLVEQIKGKKGVKNIFVTVLLLALVVSMPFCLILKRDYVRQRDTELRDSAIENLDASLCERISNGDKQEDCYYRIAVKTGDSSLCEKIPTYSMAYGLCVGKAKGGVGEE